MGNSSIQFEDYSLKVIEALSDHINAALAEVGGEIVSQTQRNSRVDTGETKNSFKYVVEEAEHKVTIGSPKENAIWEELGTGEHALNGNGRKGGWTYKDENGDFKFTLGKTPTRAFFKAYTNMKPKIINHFKEEFAGFKEG